MIAIGRVVRPHGLRGEVRVASLSDLPDRLRKLGRVLVEKPDGTLLDLTIQDARGSPDAAILKFRGVDSFEQAESLRGAFLVVPREELPPLPDGTFYVFDLIGFEVRTEEGQPVGTVRDVLRFPANDAYVVGRPGGEILIPAVRDFVRIDTGAKTIFVRGIDTLLN
jgi:16S rRNA processing protein RimM